MQYGSGKYTYELVDGWLKLPEGPAGESFCNIGGMDVDSQDRVYIFNRGTHPVMVFDSNGNLLSAWGEGLFGQPHGICVGPDGSIYCTDVNTHTAYKFSPEGKLLLQLGTKDKPSDTGFAPTQGMSFEEGLDTIKVSGPPFNRPTDVALSSSGEIYVSDGYGNARIHKFAPDGSLLLSWGEPGRGQGQFRVPHSVCVDSHNKVWVADRQNHRLQIFDTEGKFVDMRTDLGAPCTAIVDKEGAVYIPELEARRISILHVRGEVLARFGNDEKATKETATFPAPHALTVDSKGDIYVGNVFGTKGTRAVQKLARKR